jgi:hypothetical protein
MLHGFMDAARSKIVSIPSSLDLSIISVVALSTLNSLGFAAAFFTFSLGSAALALTSSVVISEVPPLSFLSD